MRYFGLLFLLLQQLFALAQIDTLQGKDGLEHYLKQTYYFNSIHLGAINTILKDSAVLEPAHPAYWLRGDFNHDGKPDLLLTATVIEKGRKYPHDALFMLASTGKRYSKVDLYNPVNEGAASYSTYRRADKQYVVLSTLSSDFYRLANGSWSRALSYRATHDTLYVENNRLMIYTAHPTSQPIAYIKFERTECFGTCPVFQATIDQDGSVEYTGIKYVDRLGHLTLLLSKADRNYLFALLTAINLSSLQDEYQVNYTDAPTAYLTVRYADGRVKKIEDYGLKGSYGLSVLYSFLTDLQNF